MKTTILIGAFGALAMAQNFDNLGACGKQCATSMIEKHSSLGCPTNTDVSCLCKKNEFLYGLRDCNAQACPEGDRAANTAAYLAACPGTESVLSSGTGTNSASASGSGSGASSSSGASESASSSASSTPLAAGIFTTTVSESSGVSTILVSTGTNSAGSAITSTLTDLPGATGGLVGAGGIITTITNTDGSVITSTIASAAGSASSAGSSAISSGSSAVSSAESSLSSGASSVSSALSSDASNIASSASAGASSAAGISSTTRNDAPRATAFAGLAGAGIAVLALL